MKLGALIFTLLTSLMALAEETPQEPKKKSGSAMGSFGGAMGGMNLMPPLTPTVVYGGQLAPDPSGPAVSQHRLNVGVPVIKEKEQVFALSANGTSLHFHDPLVLNSGTPLSQDFYRAEIGAQYTRNLADEKNWGLRGSLGSTSDKLFANSQDLTFTLNFSYSYANTEYSRWIWFLFLANNSTIVNYVPIPGFIYLYKTESFTGMFGIPLISLQWVPVRPWYLNFTAFGPSLNFETGIFVSQTTQWMLGASWSQQSYLRDGRQDEDDRLFFDEKRVFAGVRAVVFGIPSEFQVGHNFQRSLYEGDGFLNDDRGSVDLEDSWNFSWNLRYAL